jgi:hypothetical protein
MDSKVQELADSLRELATFIEEHPQFAPAIDGQRFLQYCSEPEKFFELAASLGGQRSKNADDLYFGVTRQFGSISLYVYAAREEVCEATVVGTEKIVEAAVRCVHCNQPIVQTSGDFWRHMTADEQVYTRCGTTLDEDGNEVGGQPATPPSFAGQVVERPVIEWKCRPVLGTSDAHVAHYAGMNAALEDEKAVSA